MQSKPGLKGNLEARFTSNQMGKQCAAHSRVRKQNDVTLYSKGSTQTAQVLQTFHIPKKGLVFTQLLSDDLSTLGISCLIMFLFT